MVFIRFNPDKYINDNNITIKSCWKTNQKGILVVDDKQEWNDRLTTLKTTVEYWLKTKTKKMIKVVHLFYDKCDNSKKQNDKSDSSEDEKPQKLSKK
jgi:hypothetical protein